MANGNVQSFKVTTTLLAQRIVAALSVTSNTVAYPESLQHAPFGITIDTVLETNQAIPVQIDGIAKLYFNDTVAAGAIVASDSSGRGVPMVLPDTTTSLSTSSYYVGFSRMDVDITGTIADVLINPGVLRQSP